MRILLKEVMLHLPRVVVPQLVGQLHLGERVLHQVIFASFVPRPGQLQFVEDSKFHNTLLGLIEACLDSNGKSNGRVLPRAHLKSSLEPLQTFAPVNTFAASAAVAGLWRTSDSSKTRVHAANSNRMPSGSMK